MRVWIVKWDNRPPEAYGSDGVAFKAVIDDEISNGYFQEEDIEGSLDDGWIAVDDWMHGELVTVRA